MKRSSSLARPLLALCALALLGTAPGPTIYSNPKYKAETLVVPPNSPVQLRRFGKHGTARFSGRFLLTGKFTYGCAIDCDGPAKDAYFRFDVEPDASLAARLPHYPNHKQDILIVVASNSRLVRAMTSARQRARLRSDLRSDVTGRIGILVDHLEISLECDSANYAASFVALAHTPKFAQVAFNGNYGCG